MSEAAAIERVADPVTVTTLVEDLRGLGVEAGDSLFVHSSLSALGWVAGGPQAVVDALQEVLTPEGTLAMPTFTSQLSDPADWSAPPVPGDWVEPIRAETPAYRPAVTPTRGVGAVPECFRSYPGVHRSAHPITSISAWGADAAAIVADHGLDYRLGDGSPLADLYDRGARVLMLGTDHATNTSLHLAENRADLDADPVTECAPIRRDGERVRATFENIPEDTGDFQACGAAFEREVGAVTGGVGAATARLLDQRDLVDFAVDWFERERE
jgi:aminoglycoside 3-N-acetyltransferase